MKRKFYQLSNKSFEELNVKNYKELWQKIQEDGYNALTLECVTIFKKVEDSDNSFHAIFSTAKEDRHGDIVEQKWDLRAYKKNPVYLDSHNYDSIEHIIGKVKNIEVKDNKLQGDVIFALDNPKGQLAFNLVAGGFLNTSSVGFIPKVFDDKGKILESELLENSGVSVPANADALFKQYDKSNNIPDAPNPPGNGDDAADNNNGGEAGTKANNEEAPGDGGDEEAKQAKEASKKELVGKWDEADSMIYCKVRDVAEFDEGSFKKITLKSSQPKIKANIAVIAGGTIKKIQGLQFDKNDGWTIDDAKKWFSTNQQMIRDWAKKSIEEKTTVKINPTVKAVKSLVEKDNKIKTKRQKLLNITMRAVEGLGAERSETRSKTEGAKENSILNRAIRKLIKEKKLNSKGN